MRNAHLVSLLLTALVSSAWATQAASGDPVKEGTSFKVNMYPGPQWKMNLMMAISRPARITITVRNPDNTVLYREIIKRGSRRYWRKFDFEGSEPGAYRFEISDGQQTIVRRVEIVSIPVIDAQRYLVYGPQLTP